MFTLHCHLQLQDSFVISFLNASRECLLEIGKVGKRLEKIEEEEGKHVSPNHITPLDVQVLSGLRRRYDETSQAETRNRYQMFLLAKHWLYGPSDCAQAQSIQSQAHWRPFLDARRQAVRALS
jgi:hypothetical protein